MLLHQRDRAGDGAAVGQALLADERRPHVRHRRDPVVVRERVGRHQRDAMALGVEAAHVEEPEIGAAAPAGAEDPGADRERLDVVERELAGCGHANSSWSTRAVAETASSAGAATTRRSAARVSGV